MKKRLRPITADKSISTCNSHARTTSASVMENDALIFRYNLFISFIMYVKHYWIWNDLGKKKGIS